VPSWPLESITTFTASAIPVVVPRMPAIKVLVRVGVGVGEPVGGAARQRRRGGGFVLADADGAGLASNTGIADVDIGTARSEAGSGSKP